MGWSVVPTFPSPYWRSFLWIFPIFHTVGILDQRGWTYEHFVVDYHGTWEDFTGLFFAAKSAKFHWENHDQVEIIEDLF